MTPATRTIVVVQKNLIRKALENALFHMGHLKNILANANEPYSGITVAEEKVQEAGFWAGVKCNP